MARSSIGSKNQIAAIVKGLSRLTFYEESGVRIPVAVQKVNQNTIKK